MHNLVVVVVLLLWVHLEPKFLRLGYFSWFVGESLVSQIGTALSQDSISRISFDWSLPSFYYDFYLKSCTLLLAHYRDMMFTHLVFGSVLPRGPLLLPVFSE